MCVCLLIVNVVYASGKFLNREIKESVVCLCASLMSCVI